MSVREIDSNRFYDDPYPKEDIITKMNLPCFVNPNENKNQNAAEKIQDILKNSRRHRPSHHIYRHHHPRDWEGKPVPPPRSRFAKDWTCETSVINTEIAGVKVTLYVFCVGLMQPSVVVEVAKGPEYMKGWQSHPHSAENSEQFNLAIEKCKNALNEEVIKPCEEQKRINQKCKEAPSKPEPEPEKSSSKEKPNFFDPQAELKNLLNEMKDFDFVYKAFVESWMKRKDPNHVHNPKLFEDPKIQKLAEQLHKLELFLEALTTKEQLDPAEAAEYLAEALREQVDDFKTKKQNEPMLWYEKAISMLMEKLKRIDDFQKKVRATTRKPFKPLLEKMEAIDNKVKAPFRMAIKDARKDLKYLRETGEYDKWLGREKIDQGTKLSRAAEKIEQTIKTQKGNKIELKIDGETKTISKKAAAKVVERLREEAHIARVKGTLQTAKGFAKTSTANVGRAALKNVKEQVNGFGNAAGGSLGSAVAYAITDKNLRADPKEFAKTVTKETGKSLGKESVKSLGHAAGVEAVKQVSKTVAENIPSVSVLSFLWNVGENAVKSKTPEGFVFKTGLMVVNTGISIGLTAAGAWIPIPGVGPFMGSFAGGLLNQGLNWVVTEGATALDLLPTELLKET